MHTGCPPEEPKGRKRHKLNHEIPCYSSSSVTNLVEKAGDVPSMIKIKARLRALETERETHRRALDALENEKNTHRRALDALEKEKGAQECALRALGGD